LLIGSSAAVYGLLSTHLITVVLNNPLMPARGALEVFTVASFLMIQYFASKDTPMEHYKTSRYSHLAGTVTGFLLSPILLKDFSRTVPNMYKEVAFSIYVSALCLCIIVSLF
jgi:predicted membrane channel-forming protein YqfA (hemolysin III family)